MPMFGDSIKKYQLAIQENDYLKDTIACMRGQISALKAGPAPQTVDNAIMRCSCGSPDVFVSLTKPDVYWCRGCHNMWTTQHQ